MNIFAALLFSIFISTFGYGISFPLISITLENNGILGRYLGLISAAPAFGWLLGSFYLPNLQIRFGTKFLMQVFLALAAFTIIALYFWRDYWSWLALRFVFGGGLGLFYRTFEYWINQVSKNEDRGKRIGQYSTTFMGGIILGSLLQSQLGIAGFLPYGIIFLSLLLAIFLVTMLNFGKPAHDDAILQKTQNFQQMDFKLVKYVPIAFVAICIYGFCEDIPAYLMPVYALKQGLDAELAGLTLAVAALGGIIFPIPIGMLSDRISRKILLTACAMTVVVLSLILPFTFVNPIVFFCILGIWAGVSGGLYSISLAMIGDASKDLELINSNAIFGIFYACAGLIGALINGFAIELFNGHGVMISVVTTYSLLIGIGMFFAKLSRQKFNQFEG